MKNNLIPAAPAETGAARHGGMKLSMARAVCVSRLRNKRIRSAVQTKHLQKR